MKEFIKIDQDHAAFPTLESALNRVEPSCGFNIEVKLPQKLKVSVILVVNSIYEGDPGIVPFCLLPRPRARSP